MGLPDIIKECSFMVLWLFIYGFSETLVLYNHLLTYLLTSSTMHPLHRKH